MKWTAAHPGCGNFVPPDISDVIIYFVANDCTEQQAKEFFREYDSNNWLNRNGDLISNWKVLAWTRIYYQN